jgi:hypothetical protein
VHGTVPSFFSTHLRSLRAPCSTTPHGWGLEPHTSPTHLHPNRPFMSTWSLLFQKMNQKRMYLDSQIWMHFCKEIVLTSRRFVGHCSKQPSQHRISNSCTWPSALLGRLFPSPNWLLWKFYPPKFPATLVLKTMTARRSPLYFWTVGGQENHVQSALLIESGVVREFFFYSI